MIQQIIQAMFMSAPKSDRTSDDPLKSVDFLAILGKHQEDINGGSEEAEAQLSDFSPMLAPLTANLPDILLRGRLSIDSRSNAGLENIPEAVGLTAQTQTLSSETEAVTSAWETEAATSVRKAPVAATTQEDVVLDAREMIPVLGVVGSGSIVSTEDVESVLREKAYSRENVDSSSARTRELSASNGIDGEPVQLIRPPTTDNPANKTEMGDGLKRVISTLMGFGSPDPSISPEHETPSQAMLAGLGTPTAGPTSASSLAALDMANVLNATPVPARSPAPNWKSAQGESLWHIRPKEEAEDAVSPTRLPAAMDESSGPFISEQRVTFKKTVASSKTDTTQVKQRDLLQILDAMRIEVEVHTVDLDSKTTVVRDGFAAQRTEIPQTVHLITPSSATPKAPQDLAAQLTQHVIAARSGGVEFVLSPHELGKIRFEIQQGNDGVRVVLTAERPETMDMLRRHSDQLLQEFRQSGFTGTSLSFGNWNQRGQSENPIAHQSDREDLQKETVSIAAMPPVAVPIYVEGQGLNLRL